MPGQVVFAAETWKLLLVFNAIPFAAGKDIDAVPVFLL
jgi:hypothetical protein